MKTILGCIADDFTGATDLAGLLARSGVKVSLRMGIPDEAPNPETTAAFEVIALKCRTSPVDEAVAECRRALEWLKAAGAERFFWKYCSTFDSTDKGNIGPVAEALMADLGTDQTIYCPAFPENGRSIFMGNLFVNEAPLAESPMRNHPLTPMRDSNLMRLLAPQVSGAVGLVNRLAVDRGVDALRMRLNELKATGTQHVIVDAVANQDLYTIAEACRDMPLMTGGSAVAMPLPDLYIKDGVLDANAERPSAPQLAKGAIILAGSCSEMTRKQVAAIKSSAASLRLDPLDLAENGNEAARAWLKAQPIEAVKMIYASAEPEAVLAAQEKLGVARAGELVEAALAELAVDARDMGTQRFVAAGGETSGAVTKGLGVQRMTIGPEIAPGVPWTYCESGDTEIALTLKSGNFGAETFFADALALLEKL
ncbi:four-carbon acid sugar kinase family protein [Halocynthiibacter sp. C4]|uniref:3-oxo-tetronate kinase n=1 Tax=Halocynthiibacter sp. C4 TaxID=2992758 RepID=UPI00237B9CB3|nr:3-oxo-tetronate kinase [Halocynthiibacter sp. C4]MDE0590403.1 four-carbon acid sugar kinase family protein [Halocynthiibacter sp. C4]